MNQEEAGSEPWKRLFHAAAGIEQFAALIGNLDGGTAPTLEVRLDQIGLVVHVDDCTLDAGFAMTVEDVIDEGLAVQLNERLGERVVGGRHARAEAGAQHHRRRDPGWHRVSRSPLAAR